MKKILIITVILLLITGCSSSHLKKINYKNFNKMIDNKETFVLLLIDSDKEGATLRNNLLNIAKKNKIKTYYLDLTKLNDEEISNVKDIVYFEDNNLIVFINEGKNNTVLSHITDPYISETELEKELTTQGFITK